MFLVMLVLTFTNIYSLLIAPPSSEENFVDRASEIVLGEVLSINPIRHNNEIVSIYRFKLSKIVKKTYLSDTQKFVDIAIPGGSIGTLKLDIAGLYYLKKNQKYLLFLIRKKDYWMIASSNDGCYRYFISDDSTQNLVFPCDSRLRTSNILFKNVIASSTDNPYSLSNFIKHIKDLID